MSTLITFLSAIAFAVAIPLDGSSSTASPSTNVISTPTLGSSFPVPTKYTIPSEDEDVLPRQEEIKLKQEQIIYGPSLIGETSFFPSGTLGSAISLRDQSQWAKDAEPLVQTAFAEAEAALADIEAVCGLINRIKLSS